MKQTLTGAAVIGTAVLSSHGQSTNSPTTRSARTEVKGQPHLNPDQIFEFVGAGHGNLPRVREMLAQEPPAQKRLGGLILAERELVLGDLETALGGASHMGNRDIALFLLDSGARIDAFSSAMLGYGDVLLALLKAAPQTATTRGPHGYTLLYHAAISGDIDIAKAIKPLLPPDAKDFNQALTSASRAGHLPMIRWLLDNGVTDINTKDGIGNTALKYAAQNNFPDIADELRQRGAK